MRFVYIRSWCKKWPKAKWKYFANFLLASISYRMFFMLCLFLVNLTRGMRRGIKPTEYKPSNRNWPLRGVQKSYHISFHRYTQYKVCSTFLPLSNHFGKIRPNLHIFQYIQAYKSPILTQYHLIPSSTKLHWPSTTKYQPVPPHTDPVPPNTIQHRLLLSQYYHVSTSSASY